MVEKKKYTNLELLAPAGSPEKMKYALEYGADAVYCGVPDFSLRARINAFTFDDLKEGSKLAHKLGKKFYVTLNIYAHNQHFEKLEAHLKRLSEVEIDGIILSDPGILLMVKKHLPNVEIHLSTQANATNWQAVKFWGEQGVTRVVLAREVSLSEIKEIKKNVPEMELEYFVHGAMCMSYSGRCILSKWMSGRSANLGDCSQPCRWAFDEIQTEGDTEIKEMKVTDRTKEHEIELEEDQHGTYFFNSKDMNLLSHLKELADAGVESFKVEGRNKSVYYLAMVMRAYRNVLDAIVEGRETDEVIKKEQENLDSLVHRGYTTGFLLAHEPEHNFDNAHSGSKHEFVGEIIGMEHGTHNMEQEMQNAEGNLYEVKVHNAIRSEDEIELVSKTGNEKIVIEKMIDEKGKEVDSAHGGHGATYTFQINKDNIEPLSLLRRILE
ncbi:MAG: U32 family peptidase C-terminal domain-containing protein [Candidatus Moranbacteria bacterium]|nr:U32 family peptidase C-terminal domain-containing protein [Candidatus Moranbacteria bacterium]